MGPELMEEMREQAIRFGADLRMEDVDAIDLAGEIKEVDAGGETYRGARRHPRDGSRSPLPRHPRRAGRCSAAASVGLRDL